MGRTETPAMSTVVKWVETVHLFAPLDHLRPPGQDLNLLQYTGLDALFMLAVLGVIASLPMAFVGLKTGRFCLSKLEEICSDPANICSKNVSYRLSQVLSVFSIKNCSLWNILNCIKSKCNAKFSVLVCSLRVFFAYLKLGISCFLSNYLAPFFRSLHDGSYEMNLYKTQRIHARAEKYKIKVQ